MYLILITIIHSDPKSLYFIRSCLLYLQEQTTTIISIEDLNLKYTMNITWLYMIVWFWTVCYDVLYITGWAVWFWQNIRKMYPVLQEFLPYCDKDGRLFVTQSDNISVILNTAEKFICRNSWWKSRMTCCYCDDVHV